MNRSGLCLFLATGLLSLSGCSMLHEPKNEPSRDMIDASAEEDASASLPDAALPTDDASVPNVCVVTTVHEPESGLGHVTRTTLNASGSPVEETYDLEGDGTIEQTDRYFYDGAGDLTLLVLDPTEPAAEDSWIRVTRDESGRIVFREQGSGDQVAAPDEIFTYFYDDGRAWTRQSQDYDGDGSLTGEKDRTVTRQHTYSVDGKLVLRTTTDHESDGVIDWDNSYEYNDDGLPIKETYRILQDGVMETTGIRTLTYDSSGRVLTKTKYNPDAPGSTTVSVRTYERDFLVMFERRIERTNRLLDRKTLSYDGPCLESFDPGW